MGSSAYCELPSLPPSLHSLAYVSELKITAGHWPFSVQFSTMATLIIIVSNCTDGQSKFPYSRIRSLIFSSGPPTPPRQLAIISWWLFQAPTHGGLKSVESEQVGRGLLLALLLHPGGVHQLGGVDGPEVFRQDQGQLSGKFSRVKLCVCV